MGLWRPLLPAALLVAAAGVACGDSSDAASSGGPGGGGDDGGAGSSDGGGAAQDSAPGTPPAVSVRRAGSDFLTDGPQYLSVRKSATELPDASQKARCEALLPELKGLPFLGNAHTCAIFNTYVLDQIKDDAQRATFFAAGFHEAQKMIGHEAVGGRRLAVEVTLDLLNAPVPTLEAYVDAIVAGARIAKVPVLFNLDAVDWWDGRPDLWNFFDAKKPGYDPKNVGNVEWAGPTADTAPRAYWRDWGSQIRVETPVPDMGSPTLRAAIAAVLGKVLPKIVDFEESLPPDQRYLYAGAIIGTELAVGVNHYYYPNGNAYLGDDPKCDPGLPYAAGCPAPAAGICQQYNHSVCPPDFTLAPSGGVAQLGYHAEKDLNLGTGTPGRPQLDAILTSYIGFFEKAVVDGGLPPTKIFSHGGGTFGANGPHSYDAAYVPGILPGWSMYFGGATDPSGSVGTYVNASEDRKALPWASPEWLPLDPGGNDSQSAWFNAIEANLNFRNNRMISVANWEGVAPNPRAVAALGQSLSTPAAGACSVPHREVIGVAHFADATVIRFSPPVFGTTAYINASSSPATTPMGTLANIDLENGVLDPASMTRVYPTSGAKKVYVQLATDGCVRDGAAQRMLSQIEAVDVGGGTTKLADAPLVFFADHGRRIATLTWDGAKGTSLTVDFSRAPDFSAAESATFQDARAFYTDGFDASFPLYARLHDGASVSNVVRLGP